MKIPPEVLDKLRGLRGAVITCNLTGLITHQTFDCWQNMRSWCDRNGFHAVEWMTIHLSLVDKARDMAFAHTLKHNYDWCLQIDGDAVFPAESLLQLLYRAYVEAPQFDMIGAYSQLKSPPFRPTIDTGSGTWENVWPNQGLVEVIRTGGHCFLTKTPILRRFGPPWFAPSAKADPGAALASLDNFARTHFGGTNPLTEGPGWDTVLEAVPLHEPNVSGNFTGEDSAFCDRVKSFGGRIAVDTDLVTGHVAQKVILPTDFVEERQKGHRMVQAALGVYS